ncbi:MAG: UDP-4-amino-4,6-dideoxy-N-acetyl-beta-L-altrosamine N-acetyltransferase [Marinobacter sp.]|nr:UDP-4-amino-4,6-dideoxy-N-acetyl-beta-L-altrosamine N-acetyltransferase [Marinobacter sp.]
MESRDLEMVLRWRNDESVRRYMYTRHEITLEEHAQWFKRAIVAADRHLLIFEREGVPLGFINFHEKGPAGIADWGFYIAPEAPRGTGSELGKTVLNYGFGSINLHKVCGQALGFNTGSIRFHEKLGFTREGVLRQQHFDGRTYHDIICFGLMHNEWHKPA